MQIRWEHLHSSRPRELGRESSLSPTVWCFAAREPGTVLSVAPGFHVLWLSLGARLQLEYSELLPELGYRQTWLSLGDAPARGFGQGSGSWLALAIPTSVVDAELRRANGSGGGGLYARRQRLTRGLLQSVARLLRSSDSPSLSDWFRSFLASDLVRALLQAQGDLDDLLARCPGKSRVLRRLALKRLLRARNRFEFGGSERLSVSQMATAAHYSTCHFVRLFETVFEESPFEFSLHLRMREAETLLRRSDLDVTEIADRLGFSSSATFARAFSSYFGTTATAARRLMRSSGGRPNPLRQFARGTSCERASRDSSPLRRAEDG